MKINKRNKIIISSILLTPLLVLSIIFFPTHLFKKSAANLSESNLKGDSFFDLVFQYDAPEVKYGFVVNDYNTTESIFKKNEFLSDVLMRHNVEYGTIDKLVKKAGDVFDVRKMRVGKNYMVVAPKGAKQTAQYFIYEPSPFRYVIYDLQNETNVSIVERQIDTLRQEASGIIYSNLWNAMMDNELSYELAVKMEDALGYSVDFHHIQDNDKFKLIYDELYIDGEPVGIGQLKAAFFEHQKKPYYAYHYEDDAYNGFFDDEGRPMKKAFLKSPVKYTRISSPFNLRRFHPVLRRVKAHLGTDYAAPRGTPIYAVANGTVSRSGYGRGNGNFVKIKHDGVYSTQYLHMSKIASTAKTGMRVKQGDVIGYVGSTGLATGPHVCFRFWKNNKQVDHRKENLPAPEPMSEEHLAIFKGLNKDLRTELDVITYKTEQEIASAKEKSKTATKKTIP